MWLMTRLCRAFTSQDAAGGWHPFPAACRSLAALVLVLGLLVPGRASGAPRTQSPAASRPPDRGVVLVLVNALTLGDIDRALTPNMWKLASSGAVGLMSARTARTLQDEHTYVTLGSGTRAQGPREAGYAFNSDEMVEGAPAAATFARNTGVEAPPGSVVHPYIALISHANSGSSYRIVPGALGEALRRAGKKTAVFGNSDTPGHPGRYAAAVAMDSRGVVDTGDVGQGTAVRRNDFPGGVATDTKLLAALVKNAVATGKASFVVVESGDSARVERYLAAGLLTEAAYERARRFALSSADALVGHIMESVDLSRTTLLVLAPTPGARDIASGRSLAPVIAAGPGFLAGSGSGALLTSATTRRDGLVASTDVAASVLSWLGVPAPSWILGAPVHAVPHSAPLSYLESMHGEIASTSLMRAPLLKTFVGLQIAAALASLGFIALAAARRTICRRPGAPREAVGSGPPAAPHTTPYAPHPRDARDARSARGTRSSRRQGSPASLTRAARIMWALLLALGAVPLAMLVLPLARPANVASAAVVLAAVVLAVCLATWATFGPTLTPWPFAAMYLLTGLAVICDTLLGSELMRRSVLGYDPIGGARFYGIGNEYMGVLIGSLITGSGLVLDGMSSRAASRPGTHAAVVSGIGIAFAAALFVLASPSLGANMGGTLAAVVGFGTAYALYLGKKVRSREVAYLAALAVLLVVGIAAVDAVRAGGPVSHWGRTALAVLADGPAALVDAVRRKAALNLKLMRYTIWTRALFAFLAAVALLRVRPVGLAGKLMSTHRGFASSLGASLAGAATAMVANDSGVVAAALLMMYPSLVMLYLGGLEAEAEATGGDG
ncbi:MAG: hypothetical protein ACM3ZO_04160 [Clostridia bacterium]